MKTILLLFLSINYLECAPSRGPVLLTRSGPVRGLRADNGDYTMYLGVPYGVVEHPFGDAKPPPRFTSIYEAVSDPVLCPQHDGDIVGDINCLNLNIYVPNKIGPKKKLPVMFYIPGGGFVQTDGNRNMNGPDLLVKHDVIIVTINYRVGIYGFLCLDIPGYNNQGLKDQVLALKWIKDNIESFGGDAKKMTVLGHSAGAMSIDLLLLAKEPLFQRVIIQSGVALTSWVIGNMNSSVPIMVAKELGFETDDVKEALDYLKTIKASNVITATNHLNIYNHDNHLKPRPCVENKDKSAMLTDFPVNLKPKVKGLDVMIGHAFREAAFVYPGADATYYRNYKFDSELIQDFNEVLDEKDVRNYYIGDATPSLELRHKILDFASDFAFAYATERTVDRYLEAGARNIYRYLFTYQGDRNFMSKMMNTSSDGALHGDELGYMWNNQILIGEPNSADQKMIDIMTKLWTDFAKYGNPTPSGPTELIPVTWEPVVGEQRPYLRIDQPLSLEHRVFNERMVFWNVYYKLHADKIKGKRS